MRSTLSLVVLCGVAGTASAQVVPQSAVDYTGHKVVRVDADSIRDFQAVSALAESIWNCTRGPGINDVQISPKKWQAFLDLKLPYSVLINDVEAKLQQERDQIAQAHMQRDAAWFTTYHNFDEIYQKVDADIAANPTLARPVSVGNSLENRIIRGEAISAPDLPGNPRSFRPQLIFNGCQHAREWISPATVMYIAEQLATQYATNPRVQNILNKTEIILVPVVNPDGYVYTWTTNRLWRKNRRPNAGGTFGVDTNRNWGYQWGGEGASTDPNNETYRGLAAFSEPETQALSAFVTANTRIRASIDFHSYSQLILSPWSYTSVLPPDAMTFDTLNTKLSAAAAIPYGTPYVAGPTYVTIYPASGSVGDWTYGARNILGYGWELRDTGQNGFVLPADQIIPTGTEIFNSILELGDWIASPINFNFPDGTPTQSETATASNFRVGVASGSSSPSSTPPTMYTRIDGGSWTSVTLTSAGTANLYNTTIAGTSCGENVDFYFSAISTSGETVTSPSTGASAPYHRTTIPAPLFSDDFETDRGWTYGITGDTATIGRWERAVPQATAAQPGNDNTPGSGTRCAITDSRAGTSAGQYDVDGGTTTLVSPTFDARPPRGVPSSAIRLTYARWYSNNTGSAPDSDSMPIEISNNGGTTWTQIELVTQNANAWVTKTWDLATIIPLTNNMKFRVVARDLGSGSVVEAGLDDFKIYSAACPCLPDFNLDGIVDFFDYLDFVDAFSNNNAIADFNQDAVIDFFDYLDFVDAFATGC